MKNWITAVLLMTVVSSSAQEALGEVQGYLYDKSSHEELISAHVFIKDFDRIYQVMSGTDGSFRISAIPAGIYTLQVRYMGDTAKIYPVQIKMNNITQLGKVEVDFEKVKLLPDIVFRPRLTLIDGDLPIPQLTGDEIARTPGKFDPKSLVIAMTSEVRMAEDGQLVFRGARKGDMIYMVDGIKANEVVNVPSVSIGNMMVYTGALPAKYGDTLGGVVVVETKSYFDLYRAWKAGR